MLKTSTIADSPPPQEHIQSLYKIRGKNDPNSTTLANTLDKDIQTVFNTSEKFVYELLQNADDAGIDDQPIDVRFIAKDNHLYFAHNGKHFDYDDVEAICDNAKRYKGGKELDIEKTGYKGIGFKSVFVITDCVHIISDEYTFRFDKHHSKWQESSQDNIYGQYPWPIIPIWTPVEKREVNEQINREHVNFILTDIKDNSLNTAFNTIIKNPEIILFLRRIRSITIDLNGKINQIKLKKDENQRTLFSNNQEVSKWITFTRKIKITDELSQKLQLLGEHECPIKLKQAQHTTIVLAVKTQDNKIIPERHSRFFSYLPTNVSCDFPFVVNADFLLTADRTQLLENIWNEYLFKHIGLTHIFWLNSIAHNTQYYKQVLLLLKTSISEHLTTKNFTENYQAGTKIGLEKIAFIPSNQNPEKLFKFKDALIDDTQFYKEFPDIDPDIESQLAHYELESTIKIPNHLSWKNLARKLTLYISCHNTIDFHIKFITFIMLHIPDHIENSLHGNRRYHVLLDTIPFILSADKTMITPKQACVPSDNSLFIPTCISFNAIHPELLKINKIREWFIHIGINKINQNYILDLIETTLRKKETKTKELSLEIIKFLYEAIAKDDSFLFKINNPLFSKLPILTQSHELKPAKECYLCSALNPEVDLESKIENNDFFVSERYLEDERDTTILRKLLVKIGVRYNIEIHFEHIVYLGYRTNNKIDCFQEYEKFIEEHDKATGKGGKVNHISRLFFVDFMRFLPEIHYAVAFWKLISEHQERILSAFKTSRYENQSNQYDYSRNITPYLVYFCSEKPSIIGTDGNLYRSKDLYTTSLKDTLGPKLSRLFPGMLTDFGNFKLTLSDSMQDYLKFNTKISAEDYLTIFSEIEEFTLEDQIDYLSNVFKLMASQEFSQSERSVLESSNLKALAADDTLQPASSLCYYPSETSLREIKQGAFLKILPRLNPDEITKICKLLSIPILNNADFSIDTENPTENTELKEYFTEMLQYWSLIEEKVTKEKCSHIYNEWFTQLQPITFVSTTKLTIAWKYKTPVSFQPSVFLDNNTIFYIENSNYFISLLDEIQKLLKMNDKTMNEILKMYYSHETPTQWLDANNYNPRHFSQLLENDEDTSASMRVDNRTTHHQILSSLHVSIKDEFDKNESDTIAEYNPTEIDYDRFTLSSCDQHTSPPAHHANFNTDIPHLAEALPKRTSRVSPLYTQPSQTRDKTFKPTNTWTGIWGEEAVFLKLKNHYRKKYSALAFTENDDTFFLQGLDSKGNHFKLAVIWHNKKNETGAPYDIEVIKNGHHRYIEVKSTHDSHKCLARFSKNEWQKMHTVGKYYQVFCVFNAGKSNIAITKIKDPAKLIAEGNLHPHEIQFKLKLIS